MAYGMLLAIVLVYLLMAVNFQSWLDPLIILMALPGAIAGVLWILLADADQHLRAGADGRDHVHRRGDQQLQPAGHVRQRPAREREWTRVAAALDAGVVRLRPVLMTALAMILGMLPMSLGLGEGGEQNAPLGRVVIGGLLLATFATLVLRARRVQPAAPRTGADGRRPGAGSDGRTRGLRRAAVTRAPPWRSRAGCASSWPPSPRCSCSSPSWGWCRGSGSGIGSPRTPRRSATALPMVTTARPQRAPAVRRRPAARYDRAAPRHRHLRAHRRLSEGALRRHRRPREGGPAPRRDRLAGGRPAAQPGAGDARAGARPTWCELQADLALARTTLQALRRDRRRRRVAAGDRRSRTAAATAEKAVDAAQATVNANQANVDRLHELQGFERVYAPFDGIITARNVDPGVAHHVGLDAADDPALQPRAGRYAAHLRLRAAGLRVRRACRPVRRCRAA